MIFANDAEIKKVFEYSNLMSGSMNTKNSNKHIIDSKMTMIDDFWGMLFSFEKSLYNTIPTAPGIKVNGIVMVDARAK